MNASYLRRSRDVPWAVDRRDPVSAQWLERHIEPSWMSALRYALDYARSRCEGPSYDVLVTEADQNRTWVAIQELPSRQIVAIVAWIVPPLSDPPA